MTDQAVTTAFERCVDDSYERRCESLARLSQNHQECVLAACMPFVRVPDVQRIIPEYLS